MASTAQMEYRQEQYSPDPSQVRYVISAHAHTEKNGFIKWQQKRVMV